MPTPPATLPPVPSHGAATGMRDKVGIGPLSTAARTRQRRRNFGPQAVAHVFLVNELSGRGSFGMT